MRYPADDGLVVDIHLESAFLYALSYGSRALTHDQIARSVLQQSLCVVVAKVLLQEFYYLCKQGINV